MSAIPRTIIEFRVLLFLLHFVSFTSVNESILAVFSQGSKWTEILKILLVKPTFLCPNEQNMSASAFGSCHNLWQHELLLVYRCLNQIYILIMDVFVFNHCCALIVNYFRQVLLLMLNVDLPKWYVCWWMELFCICNKKKLIKNLSNCRYSAGSLLLLKILFCFFLNYLQFLLHLASSTFWAYMKTKNWTQLMKNCSLV